MQLRDLYEDERIAILKHVIKEVFHGYVRKILHTDASQGHSGGHSGYYKFMLATAGHKDFVLSITLFNSNKIVLAIDKPFELNKAFTREFRLEDPDFIDGIKSAIKEFRTQFIEPIKLAGDRTDQLKYKYYILNQVK
jgi:hypothetical protein